MAKLRNRRIVTAHLADPGRLAELLIPDAELRLRPAPVTSARKTAFTASLVRAPGVQTWVSLEPGRANALVEPLLRDGRVVGTAAGWTLRREVRHGNSRFDFLLQRPHRPGSTAPPRSSSPDRLWIEVKSVTLVEDGVGLFPDAPTTRGRRHLEKLRSLVDEGDRAMVLFAVQRGDASLVRPHRGIDPEFAIELGHARRAGVLLRAALFRFDASGRAAYRGSLPMRS